MQNDYWVKYWNDAEILNSKNPQNQIGRTINKVPIDSQKWEETLLFIKTNIQLDKNDEVLDLCAGNGLISIPFAQQCKTVVAADISKELINKIDIAKNNNLTTIVADARTIEFDENVFSKVILYFAIQHFTEYEILFLFEKFFKWLKPNGLLYIGDIPDIDKIWQFFNTLNREKVYFNSIKNNEPIIGTWFSKKYLMKLSNYTGFKTYKEINQPDNFINAHYRFDMLFQK